MVASWTQAGQLAASSVIAAASLVLATKAAENAVALARGKPLIATATVNNGKIDVPSIFNPVYTVTKENMRETVIKDGFHSEADVFGKSGG